MKIKTMAVAVLMSGMLSMAGLAPAAEQQRDVYGWELMTPKERAAHREKMQSLQTEEAREQYRMEHHERMQERAEEQGVTLPDMPHERGSGQGSGTGKGR